MEEIAIRYSKDFIYAFAALILLTWLANVFATLIDMWSGIEKAEAKGEEINSGGLRRTITKIGDYWKVQAFALMIDVFGSLFWDYPFVSIVIGVGIILIELKSVIENLQEKKANAGQLPEMIKKIIKAATEKDAAQIIDEIQNTTK